MNRDDNQTRVQAARWDARLRAPDSDRRDRADFREWLADDPRNVVEYDRLTAAISLLRADRQLTKTLPRGRSPGWRSFARPTAIAASLAFVGLATTWMLFIDRAGPETILRAPRLAPSTVELADGSRLSLTPGSEVRVRFGQGLREARVVTGAAQFAITRGGDRPFVVTASDRRITAIGRVFAVGLGPGQVWVTTISGGVRVRCWHGLLPSTAELPAGRRMIAEVGSDNARIEKSI